jgi:Short C-terminal domain
MHGTIDIRSNPAVRQQVMEVVRHAAAPPAAPAPAPQVAPVVLTPPAPSTAQRLQELETLRATGVISEAEYTAKRQQIIAAL